MRDPNQQAGGWSRVWTRFTGHQLDVELATGGWTFFFRAGAVKKRFFGWNRARNINRGVAELAAEARRLHCNCLQIDSVKSDSLLGVPYVRICAHVRHIQKGAVFSGHLSPVVGALPSPISTVGMTHGSQEAE